MRRGTGSSPPTRGRRISSCITRRSPAAGSRRSSKGRRSSSSPARARRAPRRRTSYQWREPVPRLPLSDAPREALDVPPAADPPTCEGRGTVTDLAYLSAADALRLFRARELSPVELMQRVIARAEEVDGTINALCHRFFDDALEQARRAEDRYMGRGEPPRPLEGIPTAVKEEEAVAGQPWTQGSLLYEHEVAVESSCFAERILESGAIVHARSTAPEFSCAGFTHSRLWGVTRSRWSLELAVGGSSGGSA